MRGPTITSHMCNYQILCPHSNINSTLNDTHVHTQVHISTWVHKFYYMLQIQIKENVIYLLPPQNYWIHTLIQPIHIHFRNQLQAKLQGSNLYASPGRRFDPAFNPARIYKCYLFQIHPFNKQFINSVTSNL